MQKFLYKRRGFLAGVATLAFLGVFALGVVRLVNYTLPLYIGDPVSAAQSAYGDPVVAYYNASLASYKAGDFDAAVTAASQAYSKLTAEKGSIAQTDRVQKQAGDIQFLLGLCREKTKQPTLAIDAYEQALRHNPNHLAAKYNLERLLKPQGGGGAGGPGDGKGGQQPGQRPGGEKPGQQPGGGASHQPKKGI
jgi:tetratricopeptide (TPR) repeat protein